MACNAEACSNYDILAAKTESLCQELFANTLDCKRGAVSIGVGKNDQKFFSPDAAANVGGSGIGFESLRKPLENGVACIVSIRVVYGLEIIHISHHGPQGEVMSGCRTEFSAGPKFNAAAVEQTSHSIGKG